MIEDATAAFGTTGTAEASRVGLSRRHSCEVAHVRQSFLSDLAGHPRDGGDGGVGGDEAAKAAKAAKTWAEQEDAMASLGTTGTAETRRIRLLRRCNWSRRMSNSVAAVARKGTS